MAIFDLSKQQVVNILADFEERLPNNGISFFTPSANFNPRDTLSINMEASRMNAFLNMEGYTPLVGYDDLSAKGAAGQIDINNPQDEAYEITMNRNSLYNYGNVLRILAHEVCHKFLAIRGMQYKGVMHDHDEIMTELCTIYMGFGLILLNNYNEQTGYLNLEDFCHAFCVVYRSRGMSDEEIKRIVPEGSKTLVNRILKEMTELQNESMKDLVISCQFSDYNFRRRIRILQLLLENMPEIKQKHNQQDGMFRDRQAQLTDGKHPIQEMLLRETIVQNSLSDSRLDKCCDEMDNLIGFLCSTMKVDVDKVSEGITQMITCPSCGFATDKITVNTLKTLKCPKCHHYFVWDGQPFIIPKASSVMENKEKERCSIWKRLFQWFNNN